MAEFHSTLLRERFVLRDLDLEEEKGKDTVEPVIALSNRLILPFISFNGQISENFIIRSQNMHSAVRFGAIMAREFYEKGPLMQRMQPFNWEETWQNVIKGYEKQWNPDRWIVIYYNGRSVFEAGENKPHPFLDIIEQCDAHNKGDYEESIVVARKAFAQAGKRINIEHDSNIAVLLTANNLIGKCGVIVRGPDQKTTFNYTARKAEDREVKVSQCLSIAAAFLEGIQLSFVSGMARQKLNFDMIKPGSEEDKKGEDATYKLGRLNVAIAQFETMLDVTYRPERPNLSEMIDKAEAFARSIFSSEIEEKLDAGELDETQWVS